MSPKSRKEKFQKVLKTKVPKSPDGNKVKRAGLVDRAEQKRIRNGVK
jgi:hypothetical protein